MYLCQSGCGIGGDAKRPDIVLITLDTVRADHLEIYGYHRTTAPRLARLGDSGIVFAYAISQAPWTLPSVASIHTGLPPSVHGAIDNRSPIDSSLSTLAEVLRANDYRTQAVISSVFVGRGYGFARGFDSIDETNLQGHGGTSSRALTESALALYGAASDAPSFLWVHYFDPHYSYLRHEEFEFATGPRGRFGDAIHFASPEGSELHDMSSDELQYMRDVFDEEIAHTDRWIGSLMDGVMDSERGRAVVFIVTADHGEAFLDRGRLAHGKDVYDELIRVPLVIGGDLEPALKGLRVDHPVEIASIAATVLRLAQVAQHSIPGTDLISTAQNQDVPSYVFSEGTYPRGRDQRKMAVVSGKWKLIHRIDDDGYELYNRASDPSELKNLVGDPASASFMNDLINVIAQRSSQLSATTARTSGAALSRAERQKLRALGYVEESEKSEDGGSPVK